LCRSQSGNSPDDSTTVELSEPVAARFGLKYLTGRQQQQQQSLRGFSRKSKVRVSP
jgi:hypothetical protein